LTDDATGFSATTVSFVVVVEAQHAAGAITASRTTV
jgi:hypothetical protein